MGHGVEQQALDIVGEVATGTKGALEAAEFILALNDHITDPDEPRFGLIGTAEATETYLPGIPMTCGSPPNTTKGWRASYLNERYGTTPLVAVSFLGRPAVWSAIAGGRNTPMQRQAIGKPLVPAGFQYDLGTHGHIPDNAAPDGCKLFAHRNLLQSLKQHAQQNPDEIIGSIDVVKVASAELLDVLVDDPGHYGVERKLESAIHMPVRARDYQMLGRISTFYYEPQAL